MGRDTNSKSTKTKARSQPAQKVRGRPTLEQSQELDEAIKSSALELFLDQGYEATTMESIAEAAGITKRTLYKRYNDKAELFSMAMRKSREEWVAPNLGTANKNGASLKDELVLLAEALLDQALNPRTVKLSRIASAQAVQFPEEITLAYDISLSPRVGAVADVLNRHERELSKKVIADLPLVAENFIGLITGIPSRLAGYGRFRGREFESRRVELAVELFIRGIQK